MGEETTVLTGGGPLTEVKVGESGEEPGSRMCLFTSHASRQCFGWLSGSAEAAKLRQLTDVQRALSQLIPSHESFCMGLRIDLAQFTLNRHVC
ncbi:hypothetical protein E2C01_053234 [Portunus trituberculatus]|uniref:Uncharacterized protein n=1 Tax=Portunus trituberculatus TaxID=210409 RepID=A0A5B7GNM3_PORTR|nr:hypothetical protein [Portunus trituberculatus]